MLVFSDHMGLIVLYLDCLQARYLSVNCLKPEQNKIHMHLFCGTTVIICVHTSGLTKGNVRDY